MLKNGKPADKIMKKMDGKHGPLGHQRRRNHDPSTNRSNVAEIFEKKSRRNDKITLTNYNNGTQKMQFIIYFKPAYKQEWTWEYILPST